MLVISGSDLNGLMTDIAVRARAVTDHNGKPVVMSTMPESQLRAAAQAALMIATGEMIWPADRNIDLRQDAEPRGAVNIQR